MPSPARAHFIRKTAAAANQAAADSAPRPDATQYELHLAQLAEHRRALHRIKSVQRKIEFKAKVLPEYMPYIEGVLKGDSGAPDDVVTTVMVWCIDTGDIVTALDIADYVLRHKLEMPDQYKRDAATVVAEETAQYALRELADNKSNVDASSLATKLEFTLFNTNAFDMPDEVRAKLRKAYGYALRESDPAVALEQLQKALALDPRCGVKKDIERLERALKNAQPNG